MGAFRHMGARFQSPACMAEGGPVGLSRVPCADVFISVRSLRPGFMGPGSSNSIPDHHILSLTW